MLKTNYHTHTSFCDGKGTPTEIAEIAINKGFSILGFSSHSMYPFASTWHIAPREFSAYKESVMQAKSAYSGRLQILYGYEADFVPGLTKPDFDCYKSLAPDYLIGSVHYIITKNGRLAVDYSADALKQKLDELFDGDSKKMTQEYFALEREMLRTASFTIIGHADLVRKNNTKLMLFDENDGWYRSELKATADAIARAGVIAEINTGAIARGTMDSVYPSAEFLSLLHERGVPITFSSDAHDPQLLDCAFDRAKAAARSAGYTEVAYLTADRRVKFQKID